MPGRILLATDMDRTIIPNGPQPEADGARDRFRRFCERQDVVLAYVSGRHLALVEEAIREWHLPVPDYVIGDVGTTLYRRTDRDWQLDEGWQEDIGGDWNGYTGDRLHEVLPDFPGMRLQEAEKQNRYKLSYYTPEDFGAGSGIAAMEDSLQAHGIDANLIWSLDEQHGVGLLDVLPGSANKLHALRYLIGLTGITESRVMFAGDSGNDMQVFASGIKSVLVANAHDSIRDEVRALGGAAEPVRVLLARHSAASPGYYADGVLAGVEHYFGLISVARQS